MLELLAKFTLTVEKYTVTIGQLPALVTDLLLELKPQAGEELFPAHLRATIQEQVRKYFKPVFLGMWDALSLLSLEMHLCHCAPRHYIQSTQPCPGLRMWSVTKSGEVLLRTQLHSTRRRQASHWCIKTLILYLQVLGICG